MLKDNKFVSLMNSKILIQTLLILTLIFISIAQSDNSFKQTPIKLKASEVLPDWLINGSNFQVNQEVLNDGLVNIYSITSDYGNLEAEGTADLRMLVAELHAMELMQEMERKEIFGDALKAGVKAPFKGVAALITEPVETGKSAAKGVGQLFSNIGRSIVSDDPDQDNTASVIVGYDVAKRQFAHELNINPYTDNKIVRKELGKISRAAVAGGLTPRAAMAAIDSKAVTAARVTGTTKAMKELVRDNPPGKLDKINRKKLEEMGVADSLAEAFIDNYNYDPFEETLLVGELEALKVVGRDNFIRIAERAQEASVARYYRLMAQMMGAYHEKIKKIKRIQNIKSVLYFSREDRGVVVLAPVDYVFWTPKLQKRLNDFENELKKLVKDPAKEIWITGKFDNDARKQFKDYGWSVIDNAEENLAKNL